MKTKTIHSSALLFMVFYLPLNAYSENTATTLRLTYFCEGQKELLYVSNLNKKSAKRIDAFKTTIKIEENTKQGTTWQVWNAENATWHTAKGDVASNDSHFIYTHKYYSFEINKHTGAFQQRDSDAAPGGTFYYASEGTCTLT